MMKQALQGLSFAVTVAVLVGVLKLLDWTPGALDPALMKEYATVEEVAAQLGIRDLRIPRYFPATIGWPPARILGQGKPYRAVVMEFVRPGTGDTVLVIAQAASRRFEPGAKIRFHAINETLPVDLRGRTALLEAGTCEDRSACSRIDWDEQGTRIRLWMKASPIELMRIAESMLD